MRRTIAAIAAAISLLAGFLAYHAGSPASAAPDPVTCTGYPEPRVFLESQSGWWQPEDDTYGEAEHVHAGTCFPYLQTLTGAQHLDVQVMMHNVPGWELEFVRVQFADSRRQAQTLAQLNTNLVCNSVDCTFTVPVDYSVNGLTQGKWEVRVHAEIRDTVNGGHPRSLATGGWPACVGNCNGSALPQALPWPQLEGRGWYAPDASVDGYENARLLETLPTGPVSGIWRPAWRTLPGAGGLAIVHSFATVDPHFHAVPEHQGMVVLDQAGPFNGQLTIDTTQLTNGPHKLLVRGDANWPTGKLSGAMVIPFVVNNPVVTTTTAPTTTTTGPTTTVCMVT